MSQPKSRNQKEICGFIGCVRFKSKIFAKNEDFLGILVNKTDRIKAIQGANS